MDRLDIIRRYLDLQEGNALVLLPSDGSGPIELINGNEETTDMDIDICKESIRIIIDTLVVDYIKLPVGTKYITHDETIIPIKKMYEVNNDEHCITTYETKNTTYNEDTAYNMARKYEEKYEDIVDISVIWDTDNQEFVISDQDDADGNITIKTFPEMRRALTNSI